MARPSKKALAAAAAELEKANDTSIKIGNPITIKLKGTTITTIDEGELEQWCKKNKRDYNVMTQLLSKPWCNDSGYTIGRL